MLWPGVVIDGLCGREPIHSGGCRFTRAPS